MRRLLGAAALCALLLSGCGDANGNPAPSESLTATSPEVATSTAPVDSDQATATRSAAPSATAATGTASAAPTSVAPAPTAAPTEGAAPAPTTTPVEPTTPGVSACTAEALSEDILGFGGGVELFFCDGDWAYAAYPAAPGAPQFIAQRVEGRWFHAVAFGDPVCPQDLVTRGAPMSIAKLLPGCDEPSPTAEPTTGPPTGAPTGPAPTNPAPTTPPPAPDCVINTNLYGDTHAELIGVTCADATAEWELAEANAEPSWTIPWVTPTGWECFVSPYEAESKAAGACYGPDGRAYFTLYLP